MAKHKKRSRSTSSDSSEAEESVKKQVNSGTSRENRATKKHKNKRSHKKASRKKHRSSSTSSTNSSSSSDDRSTVKKKSKKKKDKKGKKKKACKADKVNPESSELVTDPSSSTFDIPLDLMDKRKTLAPMTKEEWEKQQSIVRRVYDESTGRSRLIKGSGEVIEEIVSKERHKMINQQATRGDGEYFQSQLRLKN